MKVAFMRYHKSYILDIKNLREILRVQSGVNVADPFEIIEDLTMLEFFIVKFCYLTDRIPENITLGEN